MHSTIYVMSCVCLAVTSWFSLETANWIELVFDIEAIIGLPYTVLSRNLFAWYLPNKCTSFCNLVANCKLSQLFCYIS